MAVSSNLSSPQKSEVGQSCPTLCDPMDCSLPGSIHGIFQARILESARRKLPFPSPGDLPDPGIEPGSSALQADALLSELSSPQVDAN